MLNSQPSPPVATASTPFAPAEPEATLSLQAALCHHGLVGATFNLKLHFYPDLILLRAHPPNFWEIVKGKGIRKPRVPG